MNRVASSFVKLFAAVGVALTVLTPSAALRGMQALPRGNPVVSVTLTATGTLARIGDITVPAAIYNGNYAGPVIRVRPGDELKVHLINKMSGATNIHFHGIQSSPEGRGDNVQIEVPPQGSFDYDLVIPSSQPPGLYWYHSHLHGSSEAQVMKGLSGALLVDGFTDQFPELRGVSEQLLVLKDYSFDQDTGNPRIDGYYQGFIQSINGETSALFSMRPHETQLWHIGNQSANLYFHLAVPGLRFTVIGEDGAPRTSGLDVTTIDLKPASRMEILVTAGEPGSYPILSKNVLTGTGAGQVKDRPLGMVEVSGAAESTSREVTHFASSGDLRNASIDAKRTISFSQSKDAKKYYIDGRLYDHERIDLRVPLGNIEEWTIRNESDEFHEFHIHQVNFQVTQIDGKPQDYAGRVDIVRVPERGTVTIRMSFTDPRIIGRFVFHCHVLRHEDLGMMANIEVYDPAAENAPFAGVRRFLHRVQLWRSGVPWKYCHR